VLARGERPRLGDDLVASGGVVEKATDRERAARRLGRPDSFEALDAVLADDDLPALADAILVDLEFGLDPAVVVLCLQLPFCRAAARTGLDHRVVALRRRARSAEEGGQRGDRDRNAENVALIMLSLPSRFAPATLRSRV
jgi:hypothetical protein